VGDPFTDWPAKITRIQELLKQLKIEIPIETLFAQKGLKLDQKTMTVTTIDRMDVDANNVYINGTLPTTPVNPQNPFGVPRGEPSLANAQAVTEIAEAVASAANALAAESDAALALIEAELAAQEAANAANAAALADLFAKLGLDANGEPLGSTTINVNVEGSVTAAQDLAEVITDIQYEYQRSGKSLRFSSIAI
jgi:hypothetical protein